MIIDEAIEKKWVLTCATFNHCTEQEENEKHDKGIVTDHGYSILGQKNVINKKGGQPASESYLIQVRNPHSRNEWNGDWSS